MADKRSSAPSQIRITGIGFWYVLITLVVAVAATNTGNNALFLVLALMLAFLAISGVVSQWNLKGLEVAVGDPGDLYANRPSLLPFELVNRSRWLPHRFLLVHVDRRQRARLVPMLPRGGRSRGDLELLERRRGLHRLEAVHVASPFPFGFFRKAQAYPVGRNLLVYPELFSGGPRESGGAGNLGDGGALQKGFGQELRQLRTFRPGDDPRNIHWKLTAKTTSLVYMEKEEPQGRRVSIVFDNGVSRRDEASRQDKPPHLDKTARRRFERLVSEAATAAVEMLEMDFEVELWTRDGHLPWGRGPKQRYAVLEAMALVEPSEASPDPLMPSDPSVPELRFALEGEGRR